jgi:hypothetical protein
MTVASDTQNPVDRAADETQDDATSERQQAGHERSAPPPHASFMDAGSDAIGLGRSGRYPLLPRSSMARPTASGVALWTPANARTRGSAWCRGKPPSSTRDSIPSMCSRIVFYRTSTVVHIAGPVKPEFDGCAPPVGAVRSAWWRHHRLGADHPSLIPIRSSTTGRRHVRAVAVCPAPPACRHSRSDPADSLLRETQSSGTGFPPGFGTERPPASRPLTPGRTRSPVRSGLDRVPIVYYSTHTV